MLREFMDQIGGIYIPRTRGDGGTCWGHRSQCLVDAPENMQYKYPIDVLYNEAFGNARADLATVKHFISETLGVPTLCWRDYVEELRHLKNTGYSDFALVEEQYKRLKTARLNVGDTKELR